MRYFMKALKDPTLLLAITTTTVFLVVFYPALKLLFGLWASSDEYNHAFLTIPIIIYMVWSKKDTLTKSDNHHSVFGFLLTGFSLAAYYFALLTQVNTVIFLSMYMTMFGIIIWLVGFGTLKNLLTPIFLLLILIPFPEQLYTRMTFPLQLKVSQASELLVGLFDVPLLRQGNVMNIPEKSFEVVEACSGLRSMIALITLSTIVGFFMLRSYWAKMALVVVSIPIAILMNIIRVSLLILMFHFFRIDLSEGMLHQITGLLLFAFALISLLGTLKVLEFWEKK